MDLARLVIERGLADRAQIQAAGVAHLGQRLDRALIAQGLATPTQILELIGEHLGLAVIDLDAIVPQPEALAALPTSLIYKLQCVPIAHQDGTLTVAASDPFHLEALDELPMLTGLRIELALAEADDLHRFIRTHYGVGGDTLTAMAEQDGPAAVARGQVDEEEQAQEASVIKLVNDLLAEAIRERATDVHIEPYERELIVRYRIDGVLQRASVPTSIHRFGTAIVSRLKIMSSLNIAEKRRPQDGRITFKLPASPKAALRGSGEAASPAASEFDLRVSVIPMLFGEGVVLRVLSKTAALMRLEDLGMPPGVLAPWTQLIDRPHGIVLVTGPTGSGKSTTLYASLNTIVSDEIKAITVEDPVEYHVPGVNQIQVNAQVGLDFAAGLRSILRHDPDVVMIGEIRDRETANTAIQASLTGHLVFSTLHTNDAASATTRLLDMGVEPFLVSSSVEGVLAQRLVRRICASCATDHTPEAAELPRGFTLRHDETLSRGAGCRACRSTGFRGRIGIYELLKLSEPVREQVMARENAVRIAARAYADGDLARLIDDGYAKARAGVTTIEEVVRAVSA
jgi:type II secretory ATPase GspE/PulE/Tfp pilus assembly ATPase PilB-like protein